MRMSGAAYNLLACWQMFFASSSLRAVFFTLAPLIALDLNLSTSQAGMMVSIFTLGYSLAVWGSGFLPGNRKMYVIGGALLSILMLFLMARTESFFILLVLAPLCAAGAGFYLPRGLALLTEAAQERQSWNLSVHETAAFIGMVLGPAFVGVAIKNWEWRNVLVSWGIVLLVSIFIFGRVKEENNKEEFNQFSGKFKIDGIFWLYILATGSILVIVAGLASVLPILMVRGWHLDPSYAASYVGLTRLAGLIGPFITGPLADRKGCIPVLCWTSIICLAATVAMVFLPFGLPFTILLVVLTAAASGSTPVLFAAISMTYNGQRKDQIMGTISGISSIFGSVVTPAVLGIIMERFSPSATFIAVSVAMLVWLLVVRRIGKCSLSAGGEKQNI